MSDVPCPSAPGTLATPPLVDPPWSVAIVGAGFSGTAVAVHLARQLPAGARLLLLEPSALPGRGLAYSVGCASHWLNVPAGRLGWEPEDEPGFWAWLQTRRPGVRSGDFVPRALMGDYLAELLSHALHSARLRGVQVAQKAVAVQALHPDGDGGWQLDLGPEQPAPFAQQVVLALGFGHQAPPVLPGLAHLAHWQAPGLIPAPLAPDALSDLGEDDDVLILGSGLTAVDVITALRDQGHRGHIQVLSRRGLWPQPHRVLEARPAQGPSALGRLAEERRLQPLLRQVRQWVAQAQAQGQDWRDVMASLRPATPTLWQGLSMRDKRQFMRHLMPWWDVHRHRMAPGIHTRLQAERACARLTSAAGRLLEVAPAPQGTGWQVRWQARGTCTPQTLTVSAIVNCTGASTRAHAGHSALVAQMLAAGLLLPDACGLGLQLGTDHHPLNAQGQPQAGLYYVGPMLKAQHWEAIAIPELRVHAKQVAQAVLQHIPELEPA